MPDLYFDVDAALTEVPVNILPLIDDTDFKSIEESIVYNQAGMDLNWNFLTTAGVQTQTAVTPTTGGDYDWANAGNGMYTIEIPASGGASINNDTEGFGWFTGVCTGVLPWRGPVIGFRPAAINNALINGSTTEPTSVPAATAGFVEKLNWMFLAARNKLTNTGSQEQVFNDAGDTAVGTASITDVAGTYTRGEFS